MSSDSKWFDFFFFFFIFMINMKNFTFLSSIFVIDKINMFMSSINLLVFIVLIFLIYTSITKKESLFYYANFLMIIMFSILSFISNEIYFFLIYLELSIFPMMALMLNLSKNEDKYNSTLFMFLTNVLGSLMFYVMIFYYTEFFMNLNTKLYSFIYFKYELMFFTYSLILLTKIPMFFFHFWLGKAHVASSGPCSMVLASIMLKLGSFGFFKFILAFLYTCGLLKLYFFSFCIYTSILFSVLMIRFMDMKILIAFSSVFHMNMMIPFIMSMSNTSCNSSVVGMVSHGLISSLMFLNISLMYEMMMSRSMDFNKSLESNFKIFNFFTFLMMFMNLSLPPFMNFFSELMYLASSMLMSMILTLMLTMVMMMSIFSTFMILIKMNFKKSMIPNFKFFNLNLMILNLFFFIKFTLIWILIC